MRVLVLTDGFPPDFFGGFEVSANLISRQLAKDGFDVTVLSRASTPSPEDVDTNFRVIRLWKERYNRKDFVKIPKKFHGWMEISARFGNGSANLPLLLDHLASNQYDVVLAFALEKSGASLATAAAQHGLPVVWSIGDYWLYERLKTEGESKLARLNRATWMRANISRELSSPFRYVVYNCDNIRQHFAQAGVVADYTWIIFRSCPIPESVLPYDSPKRSGNFLMVNQLFPHKGVHVALDAVSQLIRQRGHEDWKLEVVGTGDEEYRNELQRQIKEFEIEDRVILHGRLPHDEALAKMRTCRALIHAALWDEPFGRVTMEALAQGAPLISADSGAVYEVPTEACCLIYPRESSQALAEHMQRVLDDTNVGSALIERGFERAKATFRADIETSKYRQVLEAVVAGSVDSMAFAPMPRSIASTKDSLVQR